MADLFVEKKSQYTNTKQEQKCSKRKDVNGHTKFVSTDSLRTVPEANTKSFLIGRIPGALITMNLEFRTANFHSES